MGYDNHRGHLKINRKELKDSFISWNGNKKVDEENKEKINIIEAIRIDTEISIFAKKKDYMLKNAEKMEDTPSELQVLLAKDKQAKDFFQTLTKSYQQGYCRWVGSAKKEATRQSRAEKAILMLRNNQKTLKTV